MTKVVSLRMDDVGASSKYFEQYSKKLKGLGNILSLKRSLFFKAWGPYDELNYSQWINLSKVLSKYDACLTVGVTASWVNEYGSLIPFNRKFPEEYEALLHLQKLKLIRIACHGLTHCVLDNKLFLPHPFRSNRQYHREFWDWLPLSTHFKHLERSKHLLESIFETDINLLIPPGNVFSDKTLLAAAQLGFTAINCNTNVTSDIIKIIGNDHVFPFHDREISLFGVDWLSRQLSAFSDLQCQFDFIA